MGDGTVVLTQRASMPTGIGVTSTGICSGTDGRIYSVVSSASTMMSVTSDGGWNLVKDTWAYLSASAITVPSGAASLYTVGDYIMLTQTTVKYFNVIGVTDTVLTVTGGDTYTVANATISTPYYSKVGNPSGHPQWYAFTPVWTATSGSVGVGTGAGTMLGRFKLMGRSILWCGYVKLGTNFWTGTTTAWTWTLPVQAANNVLTYNGIGYSRDTGVANYRYLTRIAPAATALSTFISGADGTNVNTLAYNVPYTMGINDSIEWQIQYEI
jgi:hypothetical protein